MSYHFLCKRGIRPARTEQFLVKFLVKMAEKSHLGVRDSMGGKLSNGIEMRNSPISGRCDVK